MHFVRQHIILLILNTRDILPFVSVFITFECISFFAFSVTAMDVLKKEVTTWTF